MNDVERRYIQPDGLEFREADEDRGPMLIGYGAVFNRDSEDMGFIEQMGTQSFPEDVLADSDVRALFNHIPSNILGRSPAGARDGKTLRLSTDERGLRFEIDLPDTTLGRDLEELIRRGDVSGNSFAFTVAEDEWDHSVTPARRTITRVAELFDVGPVTYPAYPDTVVSARALDMAKSKPAEKRDDVELYERAARLREINDPTLTPVA